MEQTKSIILYKDDFRGDKMYVWEGLMYTLDVPDDQKNEIYQVELFIVPSMCIFSEEAVEVGKEEPNVRKSG